MTDIGNQIKILQIGEGNFLRAFAEDYIQTCFDSGYGGVAICQPRTNTNVINALKKQKFKYDVVVKGRLNDNVEDYRKSITCVLDCIDTVSEYDKLRALFSDGNLDIVISNTTEAGICFDENDLKTNTPNFTFPGKVTNLLYERFLSCKKDITFLPVELIENNGEELKKCVIKYASYWNLGNDFIEYINNNCHFCNTLVDRIVTGHISNDADDCSVACEPYKSWIIQADDYAKSVIPFKDVVFCNDISAYRTRKVKILNGAHTMSVLAGYLYGYDIVRDMVNDSLFSKYILKGLEQVKSTINMPKDELDDFADSVLERFNNPFIDHKLLDISLNSVSKFKARCLCSILDYYDSNKSLPNILLFGLSSLISFYNGQYVDGVFVGERNDCPYAINDSKSVTDFFDENRNNDLIVKKVLENTSFWDVDLTKIDGLYELVNKYYLDIKNNGIDVAVKKVVDYE